MKRCSGCKEKKSLENFHRASNRPDGRQSYCKKCRSTFDKERWTNHPRKRQRAKERKGEIKDWLRELKESTPCTDCQQSYPFYVMQFDHLEQKDFEISNASMWGYGKATLLAEIEKCEIVCANCHAIRTYDRV